MIRLEMKNCNMTLTGRNITQRQIMEQAKLAYSPLGKAFEKQPEKKVSAIASKIF